MSALLQRRLAAAALLAAGALCGAVAVTGLLHGTRAQAARPNFDGAMLTYASPLEILPAQGGARLYVLCNGSDQMRVLDAKTYETIDTIAVGHQPRGIVLSPDGARLFIANSWDDTISVIDTKSDAVTATWTANAEPSGLALSPDGAHLFVANRISNDVAVLDASTGAEEKRLAAGRGASYIEPSPDGRLLYVTHVYPNPTPHRTQPEAEVTVIDAVHARVTDRVAMPGLAHGFHTAVSADGKLGVVAGLYPKNLVPLAHLEHSGAFADTITLFGADVNGRAINVPLDELELYASRPFGVAISADKSRLYVGSSGAEFVTVIDLPKLLAFTRTHKDSFVTDLSASSHYVVARIPVGHDPRGLLLSPDGLSLLVANRLDDTISIIDTRALRVTKTIALAGPKEITVQRNGERAFYSSRYSFQRQIGCANCHIDSTFDGLQWDLEPDGFGRDIVDNRPIEDLVGTEPYKWNGGNPNLPTECGPRTEKYFWRSENYDDLTLTDLVTYVRSLPSRPNRWRLPNGQLTMAQERGKAIFERTTDKFGAPIPETNRCSYCHSGPKGTNQRSFDVGTKKATDNSGLLDTPQLSNIALSAPYLHDGSAASLEEIWTIYNPQDKHGRTNDLTKDELNDLIEYLRTR